MNRISIFLTKHSQKIVAGVVTCSLVTSYLLQPYYELLVRWAVRKTDGLHEIRPSERINRVVNEVCNHFVLSDTQRSQLDVFLTAVDQSCVLGSLKSRGYAFIGLPDFSSYSDVSQIEVGDAAFYAPYFQHGPYSPLGKERTELMIIPEPALRFLIARELVRIGADTVGGDGFYSSARINAISTVSGMILSVYAAYQICYSLNRVFRIRVKWPFPSRALLYTGVTLLSLFLQWQVSLAGHRMLCFKVDRAAAQIDPSFLHGGLLYYNWRLRWNRFWYDRIAEWDFKKKYSSDGDTHIDPVTHYQEEREISKFRTPLGVTIDSTTGYYLPRQDSASESLGNSAKNLNPEAYAAKFTYSIHPRTTASGNERWAGDGETINFGLTGLLASGFLPSPIARFFNLFAYPATSQSRLHSLEQMASEMSHVPV